MGNISSSEIYELELKKMKARQKINSLLKFFQCLIKHCTCAIEISQQNKFSIYSAQNLILFYKSRIIFHTENINLLRRLQINKIQNEDEIIELESMIFLYRLLIAAVNNNFDKKEHVSFGWRISEYKKYVKYSIIQEAKTHKERKNVTEIYEDIMKNRNIFDKPRGMLMNFFVNFIKLCRFQLENRSDNFIPIKRILSGEKLLYEEIFEEIIENSISDEDSEDFQQIKIKKILLEAQTSLDIIKKRAV